MAVTAKARLSDSTDRTANATPSTSEQSSVPRSRAVMSGCGSHVSDGVPVQAVEEISSPPAKASRHVDFIVRSVSRHRSV